MIFKVLRWLCTAATSIVVATGASLAQFAPPATPSHPAFEAGPKAEGLSEYTLRSNGLRVLLFPDASNPKVTVNITYLVGSRHEGYGETGMAHLLEHMLFKSTPKYPKLWQDMANRGFINNGTTWTDRTFQVLDFTVSPTNYENSGPDTHFAAMTQVVSDTNFGQDFDAKGVIFYSAGQFGVAPRKPRLHRCCNPGTYDPPIQSVRLQTATAEIRYSANFSKPLLMSISPAHARCGTHTQQNDFWSAPTSGSNRGTCAARLVEPVRNSRRPTLTPQHPISAPDKRVSRSCLQGLLQTCSGTLSLRMFPHSPAPREHLNHE